MEHDLVRLAAIPAIKFTEPQIKCYMQQLLRGLEYCHSHGVMHRDIKGANVLLDNNGNLKIGHFGLATLFPPTQGQPLTSRVVTLWYSSPQLLLGATDYGAAVDLWSVGCILAELFAGKSIMSGQLEVEQLHKIFKLCSSPSEEYWKKSKLPHTTIFKPQRPYKRVVAKAFGDFPSSALSLLEVLLAKEPKDKGTAPLALVNEKRQGQYNFKSVSDKFNPAEDGGSGFPLEPAKSRVLNVLSHSRQLTHQSAYGSSHIVNLKEEDVLSGPDQIFRSRNSELRKQNSYWHGSTAPLSRFSNSVAARGDSRLDISGNSSLNSKWPEDQFGMGYSHQADGDSNQLLDEHKSSHKKDLPSGKDHALGYASKNGCFYYSGPLVPRGGILKKCLRATKGRSNKLSAKLRTRLKRPTVRMA
ncbi:unnamed protein product [Lupinus luteus]|uniref:Protein kinase domain-containing protein n=1 Tax=Lupinus luteus TaxID=3873 RepID=A0AAV1WJQ0_LUPLU